MTLSELRLDDYPTELTGFEAARVVGAIRRCSPKKLSGVAMLIRTFLREGVVVTSGRLCPSCEIEELGLLVQRGSPIRLWLACDRCSYFEAFDGETTTKRPPLVIPTRAELKALGVV